MKVFKYKLYPSKRQRRLMVSKLETCRRAYNLCLATKKGAWEERRENFSEFDANKMLTALRGKEEWLQPCGTAELHDVSRRVQIAFNGFFSRAKKGKKAGYPRFKAKGRYDSFSNPRSACKVKNGRIRLSNDLGWVKLNYHRSIQGVAKRYTVSRDACGDWWVCVYAETESRPLPATGRNVGIDLGCTDIVTLSTGEKIANPRFMKVAETKLAKAQRRKKPVARIYRKVARQRLDLAHKLAKRIVAENDIICVEALDVKGLTAKTFKSVRKSASDAGWGQFAGILTCKAEEAGRKLIRVNPAYTTKKCRRCGAVHNMDLSDRRMECGCGHSEDRDVNASHNILAAGLRSLG